MPSRQIPDSLYEVIARDARHECGYCRAPQRALPYRLEEASGLFNPRLDDWTEHFTWERDGVFIVGRTAKGRATVAALQLNDSYHQSARSVWIIAGIYPPR